MTALRAALDTNILVYLCRLHSSEADMAKSRRASALIAELNETGAGVCVAVQSLLELFEVLTRKGRWSRPKAADWLERFSTDLELVPTDAGLLARAQTIAVKHGVRIFDAVILAAAAARDCEVLYSEDMQHGFAWRGVTIINPFRD